MLAAIVALTGVGLATVLAGCSSGGGRTAGAAPTAGRAAAMSATPAAAADCTPARPDTAGEGSTAPRTFRYAGTSRTYLLTLPHGYDGRSAAALLVQFHGFGSKAANIAADTDLGPLGAARGFVVVTPEALGNPREWNAFRLPAKADDFGFVHALVADLSHRLCIDRTRIYAAGHSNGSAFAGLLVCTPPYEFAAVAMVSATTPAGCPAGVAPATMAVAGTADPQVPYAGGTVGQSTIRIPAAATTVQAYAHRYACTATGRQDTAWPGVRRLRYTGCTDNAEVVLDTVVGGKHAWPGGIDAAATAGNSRAGVTFPASTQILAFFASHRRAP